MSSIRLRLLKWLIAPILLINLAGGALTYMLAWLPAQIAFDQSLSDAAGALGARLSNEGGAWRIDLPPQAEQVLRNDDADAVYFVVRDRAGRAIAGDADFPALRQPARAGAALAYDGVMRGEAVRVTSLRLDAGAAPADIAYIGVAKTLRKRTQIRQAIFRALVLLDGLFTLACVGLIWFSVTNGLRPLDRMRANLNARARDDLAPIQQAEVPYELEPVVHAFNGLLAKVSEGAQAQHDFLANVAHQLRTPLAGLKAQLEWLADRHEEPETAHSIRLMLLSTERMIRQTNQLLALARAEPSHFEKTRLEPVQLNLLVEDSVQQFVEQAARKSIDLGFELERTEVMGDRFLLRDLIDNLVDNALRYTPERGTVTVRCAPAAAGAQGGGLLEVEDSGPGIPPARREAVFNRFVRLDDKTTGSGLGLAIVRDIAAAHGAAIAVGAGPSGQGALFSVRFP
ncbi:sensor histidine kinase [Pseudoduganella namucuonensis]|uniref:histidine kinase n=1 Tax=Pseudoduganella namucuonensis TaxID=1035707 RepID=A0A1I7HSI5_9BURK|nr:sensor histidine kinase [Pseudoduganella namucuonensis]SFU63396.1 two-component system, OmpR family, sensor histidine kinase TctE [Pseudoduganella namucuonensis]